VYWKQPLTNSYRCSDAVQFCYQAKNPPNSPLHKGFDAYISEVLCLEMTATSGSPALLIDFILMKTIYLKLGALARIAAEDDGFPNPSGLFTLFKVDCCGVRDVFTV